MLVTIAPPVEDVDTVVVVVPPLHGIVFINDNDNGFISFVPDNDFRGHDTFSAECCTTTGSCFIVSYKLQIVVGTIDERTSKGPEMPWRRRLRRVTPVVPPSAWATISGIVAVVGLLYFWHRCCCSDDDCVIGVAPQPSSSQADAAHGDRVTAAATAS
jgi:hypothetical protein